MRSTMIVCSLFALAAAAFAAPLPQPEFVAAGACTNVALSALSASGVLSFSLSFVPGASNNVEVAFGMDADGDMSPTAGAWRRQWTSPRTAARCSRRSAARRAAT